jgi:hypothetical protein
MSELTVSAVPSPLRPLTSGDYAALESAVRRMIRTRGVVVRVADLVGGLFGSAAAAGWRGLKVPDRVTRQLRGVIEAALRRAFDLSVLAEEQTRWATRPNRARVLAMTTGAISGFIGLAGFLPDATATTLLIMRNIAAVAAEEGEDLNSEETRRACLEVLALGSPGFGDPDEEGDSGYWSARLLMHGRPMSLLLAEVAATYGLRLSQRLTTTLVPVIGAASGALVNSTFLDHYRNVARVHFTIRRLERDYGSAQIRQQAQAMAATLRSGATPLSTATPPLDV